jgi:hypothetical protein
MEYGNFLLERHFDRMTAAAAELGDDLVNEVPDLPGANSAYQIVIHCCGMLEWWTRFAILGLDVDRDRDAEFVATGSVAQLMARVDAVRAQFVADLDLIDPAAALRGDPSAEYQDTPIGRSAGGVLMHVFEELAQHHGHLDLTRDLLVGQAQSGPDESMV